MAEIEKELATPKMIADLTVNEIENMNVAASDNEFVNFVESLEKIKRDLSTVNQLPEIANRCILSKLESKLPSKVN